MESVLARVGITPRLHTIHHSIVEGETNSNWSSGLTLWDMQHGTFRSDVSAADVTIGVPAFRDPKELTFVRLLKLPFIRQRPSWQFRPEPLQLARFRRNIFGATANMQ
jgi:hypothetical protein